DVRSPQARGAASAPVLRTERLTVRFGGLAALNQVDFEVARGEIRAIIGPNASALENVRVAAQSRRHSWNMVRHCMAFRDLVEKAERALDAVGLLPKANELASNLSHGEQRNLEIGIALATEPTLLCLDEPTAGMSAAETHETIAL